MNADLVKLARGIAEGLAIVHANQFVHLDLKPDNIFLDSGNEALIGDFGISNHTVHGGVELYLKTDQGTIPYIAPEIWNGTPFKYEPDIFALGVILYKLLLGTLPFLSADNFPDYSRIICSGEYNEQPLKEINEYYERELEKAMKDSSKELIMKEAEAKDEYVEVIKGCLDVDRKTRLNIWQVLSNYLVYINRSHK